MIDASGNLIDVAEQYAHCNDAGSTDYLVKEMPEVKSFSPRNLRYMRDFYALYATGENLQQAVANSTEPILQQLVAKFTDDGIFAIPWGHHICIMSKCKGDREKALFYIKKTLENNWSRSVLMIFLNTDLYDRQGKAINNFDKALPDIKSDLAREMTKDPYNFDFLTMREGYDEKELKDALVDNVQKLLLELGKGFAFVDKEYTLMVGETEQFIDILFYNIPNHCYVVVEVKTREFQPRDMGQLGTYIAAVDGILKPEGDNPTIGLLICKTKDNVLAQYAVNAMNTPIGISEYELSNVIPEDFKGSMPSIEEIEKELKD